MLLSLVIPVYNEGKNLYKLMSTIDKELSRYNLEVILVNDGSKDNSLEVLRDIDIKYPYANYYSFSRNFGKEAAMFGGLKQVKGDACVIMDADLQHPPEIIHEMIEFYEEGYDQVVAKRSREGESKLRALPTKLFYKVMNITADVNLTDGEGDFRLLSKDVVDSIVSLNEYNRFSKGIFEWVGYKKKSIPMQNVVREEGKSSFSPFKLVDYAIDGIVSYNNKPLRICFYIGSFIMFLSILYIFVALIQTITHGVTTPGYFTLLASILLLGGIQLFCLGIVGEYIGRIYYETKSRPHYIIKESSDDHAA